MGFSAKQVKALRRNLDCRYVRTRDINGRSLSYVEGWYAISEANPIFGFVGWSRNLRFAQPRAIGLKVSDEFTVSLCRGHHRELHRAGNEVTWWKDRRIDPLEVARNLWEQTH